MNCVYGCAAFAAIFAMGLSVGRLTHVRVREGRVMHSDHAGELARALAPLAHAHIDAHADLLAIVVVAVTSDGHTGVASSARSEAMTPHQLLDAALGEIVFSRDFSPEVRRTTTNAPAGIDL